MSEPLVLTGLSTVDAAKQIDPETGQITLMLSANQSFDSAFTHARRLLPQLHPDQVRRLVRAAMPTAASMMQSPASVLGLDEQGTIGRGKNKPPVKVVWWTRKRMVAAAVMVGLVAVGSNLATPTDRAPEPRLAGQTVTDAFEQVRNTLGSDVYEAFRRTGSSCAPDTDPDTAVCVDADGTNMVAEITASPSQAAFVLFYGARQSITIRSFAEPADAVRWARRSPGANGNLAHQVGRLVVTGTEAQRVSRWTEVIANYKQDPVVIYDLTGVQHEVYAPSP